MFFPAVTYPFTSRESSTGPKSTSKTLRLPNNKTFKQEAQTCPKLIADVKGLWSDLQDCKSDLLNVKNDFRKATAVARNTLRFSSEQELSMDHLSKRLTHQTQRLGQQTLLSAFGLGAWTLGVPSVLSFIPGVNRLRPFRQSTAISTAIVDKTLQTAQPDRLLNKQLLLGTGAGLGLGTLLSNIPWPRLGRKDAPQDLKATVLRRMQCKV